MSTPSTHPKYRKDIDGLRAIAVLAVVGFHAAPGRIPGGFIGVDIFFVISGFLISTIIFKGLENKSFSFIEFYSRRIKRIFPALLIVLAACFSIGWFALLSEEFKQLSKHIAGGAGFSSNLLLWSESGYFDNSTSTKPLLHLWSLGIEEQFYMAWPLILWLAWKRRANIVTMVLFIIAISFGLNIYKSNTDPAAAFYSLQTRFWELLSGALLAHLTLYKADVISLRAHANNALTFIGTGLIITGFFLINKESMFPGWWAILPIAGTTLIILAGSQSWINRVVLSNGVLVWIGLISFPLYLWHWPLLSFLRIVASGEVSQKERFAAILASIVLAWFTYKLIETPIRLGNHGALKTKILFSLMIAAGCAGYTGYLQDGFQSRASLPKSVNDGDIGHYHFFDYLHKKYSLCTPLDILQTTPPWNGIPTCYQSQKFPPIAVAVIGDSHAQHLFPGIADEMAGSNVVIYAKKGLPLLNNSEFDKIFQHLINDRNITTVIMAAHWGAGMTADTETDLLKAVGMLAAANKTIYILDDVPTFSFEPSKCKFAGRLWQKNNCAQDINSFHQQLQSFWPIQKSLAEKNRNVKIIRIGDYFCGETSCSMAKDGILFYRDNNHLNIGGSQFLWRRVMQGHPEIRLLNLPLSNK